MTKRLTTINPIAEPGVNPGTALTFNRIQQNVKQVSDSLENALTTDHVIEIEWSTVAIKVYHGLGRAPRGFIPAGTWRTTTAPGICYEGTEENTNRDQYLIISATAAGIYKLLFY